MARRYAEGTSVTAEKSRGEIMALLSENGVTRQAQATEPEGDTIQFELDGRRYRFYIPRPTMDEVRRMYPNAYDHKAKLDGEWRRRWRANLMLLKMKLEFADGETSTVERELMPYLLTAGGKTLGELMETEAGERLLLGAGR